MKTNKTVLVVDDEVHIRRLLEVKLTNAGYAVKMAKDGVEALGMVEQLRPDAVISDIMMPKLDGKALCEQTNGLKAERPFLTVIMTGRISPDERKWIAGMRDTVFVEKPFSPSRVLEVVDRYLGVRR